MSSTVSNSPIAGQAGAGQFASGKSERRKWPVTAVGLLLLLQAVFLLSIFPALVVLELLYLPPEAFEQLFAPQGGLVPILVEFVGLPDLDLALHFASVTTPIPDRVLASAVFSSLSLMALLTGVAFLSQWRRAWMLAVFLQALLLALALVAYYYLRHAYIYLVMLFSVYLVFYLNHYEVRIAFQPRRSEPEGM
jgi:hypothetical protein